jgi:hypothetical protein
MNCGFADRAPVSYMAGDKARPLKFLERTP